MKTMINNSELNFQEFEILNENEMLQVRGGADVRPKSRDIDQFDEL
jgi:hypothetical protein